MKLLSQLTPLRSQTSMWDPIRELTSMENRLERFFNAPFSRGLLGNGEKEAMTVTQWAPLVDISEDDKEYLVRAELPDLKKEDVNVTVENGELTITGERKLEKEEKGSEIMECLFLELFLSLLSFLCFMLLCLLLLVCPLLALGKMVVIY